MTISTIITVAIVAAVVIAFAVATAIYLAKKYKAVDDWIDDKQRLVNKLENKFAAQGATWVAELLENIVVGDEEELIRQLTEWVEAEDITKFFNEKVSDPITVYNLHRANEDPAMRERYLGILGIVEEEDDA